MTLFNEPGVWNLEYKLYRDGTLYRTSDRGERDPIPVEDVDEHSVAARRLLQSALDSMPSEAMILDRTGRKNTKNKGPKL